MTCATLGAALALLVAAPLAAQERPAATPSQAERARHSGTAPDRDEPGRADATNTQPAGDPRAERARENKLGDSDVA
ncbi:MAG: hypothetical protein JO290_02780, partial [Sphingomonadaceae bacterium]|nr:hypothetical protein [Sphingomonadaceae bacterium]